MRITSRWIGWVLVLCALGLATYFAYPRIASFVFTRALQTASPWPVRWDTLQVKGLTEYELEGLYLNTGRGELTAEKALARISVTPFERTLKVNMIFTRPTVRVPTVSKNYHFRRGRFEAEWNPDGRVVRYSEWVSDELNFNGEGRYDSEGSIVDLTVEGIAQRSFLSRWLAHWKTFEVTEDGLMTFKIAYEEGAFHIYLDGKPFFKAQWY